MLLAPKDEFALAVDRAAGLLADATSATRDAARGPLPAPHRRLLGRAIVALQRAQDDLFLARNDPWSPPRKANSNQLELL